MPQITKIRIANFQYNDGKRIIADELFSLERENKGPSTALINLANGGGKSVLVQLMMQPIIPKAKVAGRRIESFFTKSTDHCFVVLEWALDGGSRMKLMTGIAMSASDAAIDADAERGFQIKYYTFLSTYQNEQSPYTVTSLPLSGKENGRFIPAAFDEIRNLAKKSGGALERYASDDGAKWRERLAEYGISQNEWRLIEALNSNEDGMSKFFADLKTSDSVIDQLIIPRIEEKLRRSASGDDSSLETMLISYAKQFSRQQEIIREREVCDGFRAKLEQAKTEAEKLWTSHDSYEKGIEALFAYSDALTREMTRQAEMADALNTDKMKQDQDIRHIQWEKASAAYYTCKAKLESETENCRKAESERKAAEEQQEAARKRLRLLECAHYFGQWRELTSQLAAITEEIQNRERDSGSGQKLAVLKYSALCAIRAELDRLTPEAQAAETERDRCEAALNALSTELTTLQRNISAAASEADKREAVLEKQTADDDRLVEKLGIGAFRMLDGSYQPEDLQIWQDTRQQDRTRIAERIAAADAAIREMEARKDALPQMIFDVKGEIRDIRADICSLDQEIETYRQAEASIRALYGKYTLDDSLRFTDRAIEYLSEEIEKTDASVLAGSRRMEESEEAITAAERGTLHITKLLTTFLDGSGVRCVPFEKYLLSQQKAQLLSREDCEQLLERYPYAPYGVIVDSADAEALRQETEGKWLPAVLPVFTEEDVSQMLKAASKPVPLLSAYSQEYFRNPDSYLNHLKSVLETQREQKDLLEQRTRTLRDDRKTAEAFSVYTESWEVEKNAERSRMEQQLSAKKESVTRLEEEQSALSQQIAETREEKENAETELRAAENLLSVFEDLLNGLNSENTMRESAAAARRRLRDLKTQEAELCSQKDDQEAARSAVISRLDAVKKQLAELDVALTEVADAEQTDRITDSWSSLLQQYKALSEAQSADMKRLNADKERLLRDSREKGKELQKRGCLREEYEGLVWSEELETEAIRAQNAAETRYRAASEAAEQAHQIKTRAEADCNHASKDLSEYDRAPLPQSEVGTSFEERIEALRCNIAETEQKLKELETKQAAIHRLQGKTESMTDTHTRPVRYAAVELEEDPAAQLDSISKQIADWKKTVEVSKRQVGASLDQMEDTFGSGSADIHLAISVMRDLMTNTSIRGDRYFTLCEHIDANIHTALLRIAQIDTDLAEFHKTKEDLIHQCMLQGRLVFEGLTQLAGNSKVKVQDKRRQMLKFDIPEAVDDQIAHAAISAEIDRGTAEIVAKMSEDAYAESEVRKIASRTVGSRRLLRRYIGAETIVLRAYKIDRNPDNSGYRTWAETQVNNSGAEKFVVYFAVILALMAYTRDHFEDMDSKFNRSVLILDNPFGPISSKHVLEPMFEIARNYHVQMICLSDISKSDVVSCFDLVIRAVIRQFALSSKDQLTHEGNETIEHGFYRAEQIHMSGG